MEGLESDDAATQRSLAADQERNAERVGLANSSPPIEFSYDDGALELFIATLPSQSLRPAQRSNAMLARGCSMSSGGRRRLRDFGVRLRGDCFGAQWEER